MKRSAEYLPDSKPPRRGSLQKNLPLPVRRLRKIASIPWGNGGEEDPLRSIAFRAADRL